MDILYLVCVIASVITVINAVGIAIFVIIRRYNQKQDHTSDNDSVQDLSEILKQDIMSICEESCDSHGVKLYEQRTECDKAISNQTSLPHRVEMDTKTLGYVINERDFNPETWDGKGYLIK